MSRARAQAPSAARPGGILLPNLVQKPAWLLAFITAVILLPFAGKPFHIDDPLFVWCAQHIKSHPLNPYGFNVNWYGYDCPMSVVTKNPPFACYYLAAFGSIFGWTEMTLHLALLLPAIAVVVGAYRLARRFCNQPLLAAFLVLFAPVFLISSTTVMCDVLMLAFWVWALIFWTEAGENKRPAYFAAAAALIALAALTKYFGACLLPLVVLWSVMRKQPVKQWLGWLAVPLAALIAYQMATRALYGRGLLADAGKYATTVHGHSVSTEISSVLSAFTFTGGCLAGVFFFMPFLWTPRKLLTGAVISFAVSFVLILATEKTFATKPGLIEILQLLFWAGGGISVLALTLSELYRRRDAQTALLGCWLIGTFIFTAFLNWIINGRSLLPMVIPAAILVVRKLEQRFPSATKIPATILAIPVTLSAALAIWVTAADYSTAVASQVAARSIQSAYADKNHTLWFQGHWGFQYYMQQGGARPLDLQSLQLLKGDFIAMPAGNSNVYPLKEPVAELETFSVPISGFLTTMNKERGAGFYASLWGPLPFAFGRGSAQDVTVLTYDPTNEAEQPEVQKK